MKKCVIFSVLIILLSFSGILFANSALGPDITWRYINDNGSGMKDDDGNPISHGGFTGYMSKYETTNAQYAQYLNAAKASGDIIVIGSHVVGLSGPYSGQYYYDLAGTGDTYWRASNGGAARINWTGSFFTVDSGFDNHPVTYVSWYGSTAFASYYGWRLPTEWEWQAVADHYGEFTYGCGTTIDYKANYKANYDGSNASMHPYGTTVVGAFGTYGYGMADMAGNAWEWTDSIYSGSSRVLRGGGWYYYVYHCEVSFRHYFHPVFGSSYFGFRVCRDIDIPDVDTTIDADPAANKLIVLVHGCGSNPSAWADDMKVKLDLLLDASWHVMALDWQEKAKGLKDVRANGKEQGNILGDQINKTNAVNEWEHVHLIGHSAGAALINQASEFLVGKRNSSQLNDFSASIHLTFLDPFVELDKFQDYGSSLEAGIDWADNYFTIDLTDLALITIVNPLFDKVDDMTVYMDNQNIDHPQSLTSGILPNARNVLLKLIFNDPIGGHAYPYQWYGNTIDNKSSMDDIEYMIGDLEYGFGRGLEAGLQNWENSLSLKDGMGVSFVKPKTVTNMVVDLSQINPINSITGVITMYLNILNLMTGSPVWSEFDIDIPEDSNYISFSFQFINADEGYLTAYLNGNLILIGDQRFEGDSLHESGRIIISDLLEETNRLALRLDPIDEGQASVSVSNIEFGTITNIVGMTQLKAKAGKTNSADSIQFSGFLNLSSNDLDSASEIVVSLESAHMDEQEFVFPINGNSYKKGKYNCSRMINASKQTFKFDPKKGKMVFSAKNVDMTGLSCPIKVTITVGDQITEIEVNEDIVNGSKPCPPELMMGIADSISIDKYKIKRGKKPNTDSVTVSGFFTIPDDINKSNPMVMTLGGQTFTVSGNQFASKGSTERCKAECLEGGDVKVKLDFAKCKYNITVKNTTIQDSGQLDFGLDIFGNELDCATKLSVP